MTSLGLKDKSSMEYLIPLIKRQKFKLKNQNGSASVLTVGIIMLVVSLIFSLGLIMRAVVSRVITQNTADEIAIITAYHLQKVNGELDKQKISDADISDACENSKYLAALNNSTISRCELDENNKITIKVTSNNMFLVASTASAKECEGECDATK